MQPDEPAPTAPDVAPDAAPQTPPDGNGPPPAPSGGPTSTDEGADTFPREYVEQLRRSEAGYRTRARHADALAAALVTAHAAATGRLADPTDLPYDEALCDDAGLPDPAKVAAAVDDLLARKPHLASRRPLGDVGQGARAGEPDGVSLAGLLRAGAG